MFCHSATTMLYRKISAANSSSVADDVTRSQSVGLWLCHTVCHLWPSSSTSSVSDERRCQNDLFYVALKSHLTVQLHWLKARERIGYKLAVLVYESLHGTGPAYLVDELSHSSDFESCHRFRSASSLNLIIFRTRLSTIVRFLSLVLVSGTVLHLMSNLCPQLTFWKLVLKHFSPLALFLNYSH